MKKGKYKNKKSIRRRWTEFIQVHRALAVLGVSIVALAIIVVLAFAVPSLIRSISDHIERKSQDEICSKVVAEHFADKYVEIREKGLKGVVTVDKITRGGLHDSMIDGCPTSWVSIHVGEIEMEKDESTKIYPEMGYKWSDLSSDRHKGRLLKVTYFEYAGRYVIDRVDVIDVEK